MLLGTSQKMLHLNKIWKQVRYREEQAFEAYEAQTLDTQAVMSQNQYGIPVTLESMGYYSESKVKFYVKPVNPSTLKCHELRARDRPPRKKWIGRQHWCCFLLSCIRQSTSKNGILLSLPKLPWIKPPNFGLLFVFVAFRDSHFARTPM